MLVFYSLYNYLDHFVPPSPGRMKKIDCFRFNPNENVFLQL